MTSTEQIGFHNSRPFRAGIVTLAIIAAGIAISYKTEQQYQIEHPITHHYAACDGTEKTRTGQRFSDGHNKEITEYAVCIQNNDRYMTSAEIKAYIRQ